MFPYVGCSFDLQLRVSKLNFHVTELETLRYFCHFFFFNLLWLVFSCPDN